MSEWKKAIEFINQNGVLLDRLRIKNLFKLSYKKSEVEEILSDYQFPNGSWDYKSSEENLDRIGSLGGTIHCLRWIREFHLEKSDKMKLTLPFLQKIQKDDGSFYETPAKLNHSPQRWLNEDRIIDTFYFTAAVPMRLFSLGYKKSPIIQPSLNWLKLKWNDWNIVAGTWYGAWALLCLNSYNIGLDTSLYNHCRQYTLDWLPRLPAQPLTWLLDVLIAAEYSLDDEIVKKGINHLKSLQNS
ncbi:MAG: hypothetical protein ACFFEO_15510, partial [Candidatus Thorarchaeota archaeon]